MLYPFVCLKCRVHCACAVCTLNFSNVQECKLHSHSILQDYPSRKVSFAMTSQMQNPRESNTKRRSRTKSNITLHIPTSMQDVKENYCIQALAQTTLDFCRDSTLHGVKHVVVDLQELGSSYSR